MAAKNYRRLLSTGKDEFLKNVGEDQMAKAAEDLQGRAGRINASLRSMLDIIAG